MHAHRLTPVNIWNQSRDFLSAAQREFRQEGGALSFPAYFLAARSIELSLKSFLLLQGADERTLRRISHDLVCGLSEARSAGLDSIVAISNEDEEVVAWINTYYESKDLEYPKTGMKSFPEPVVLVQLAEKLAYGLHARIRTWRS